MDFIKSQPCSSSYGIQQVLQIRLCFVVFPRAIFLKHLPAVLSMSFYSYALTSWCFADPGRDCPSQGQLIPRDSKQFTGECAFQMQTKQSKTLIPQLLPLSSSYTQGHYPSTPGLGQPLCPRAHPNYSNQPILNLLTLPHHFPPSETTIKALAHIAFLSLMPPDQLYYFAKWPYIEHHASYFQGSVSIKTSSFMTVISVSVCLTMPD